MVKKFHLNGGTPKYNYKYVDVGLHVGRGSTLMLILIDYLE
jgi:hypothetical protein